MTSRVRALALLGAWLSLAAHLAGIAHLVGVKHATCPTHGEVIHESARPAAPAPASTTSADAATSSRGTASWSALPLAASGGEDHCLVPLTRRRELIALPATGHAPPVPPPARMAALLAPIPCPIRPIPVYRLAPKTPPPAPLYA